MTADRDEEREAATVVDVPRRKPPTSSHEAQPATVRLPAVAPQGSRGGLTSTRSASLAADAAAFARTLQNAELARTRRILPFVIGLALVAFALLPFAGGDPLATRLAQISCGVAIVAITYLHWVAGSAERFTEGRVGLAYSAAIVVVFGAVFYWGIFSPAAALVGLAIFFVTLGRSRRIAIALYLFAAAGQAALAIAVIAGWLRDRGLVTGERSDVRDQVIQQVMLQVVFATTFLIARATRVQLDKAVSEHDQAVRQLAQREALLVEARADLDQALKIGGPGRYSDQVVGAFRLGVVIGRGAMGDVYEAVHVETGDPAAVKLLNSTAMVTPGQLTRFYREADAAAKLESVHIVRLLDVSRNDEAIPFIAMERLRGQDLSTLLRERRRLPLGEAVELVQQVARALEAARGAGIVHRDIKPQNIFLAELGGEARVWKLLDFGVSKLADTQGTLTKGHVVGTPMYMAPEQARGDAVDHRGDTLALATVAYRAITGQPPYAGRDVPTILFNVVHKIPQRPGEIVKLPRDVDRVLAIGMAKAVDARFASALELAEALTAASAGKLSRELRERSDALIAAHPWGSDG
jgi:serine/threonine-protein kinase